MDALDSIRSALQIDLVRSPEGEFPAGTLFADGLLRLLNDPLCHLPGNVVQVASALAKEVGSASYPHTKFRIGAEYSPAYGLLGKAPVFCSVIRLAREPDSHLWIRIALLEIALEEVLAAFPDDQKRSSARLSRAEIDLLIWMVYRPLPNWNDEFHHLIWTLDKLLRDPSEADDIELDIPEDALTTVPERNRARMRRALLALFLYMAERPRVLKVTPSGPSGGPRPPPVLIHENPLVDPWGTFPLPEELKTLIEEDPLAPPDDDFVDQPLLAHPPGDGEARFDEGEDASEEAKENADRSLAAQARDAEHRYHLYLAGSLQPEVARTLTPPEYRASLEFILRELIAAQAGIASTLASWLILLISALTSRSHQQVKAALTELASGASTDSGAFWVQVEGFGTRMPLEAERKRRISVPEPVTPAIFLKWPTTVAAAFREIWSARSDWTVVLSRDLVDGIHEAAQLIRDQVCNRFSLVRLRNALAAAIYTGTGDDCLAQIVTGNTLLHSNAPLHYYSNQIGRMRRGFALSVGGWLPRYWVWIIESSSDDKLRFGLPRARLDDAEVQSWIAALAARANLTAPPRSDSKELCDLHNRLTAYVVALFLAGTTHRFTLHFSKLTLRHIILNWGGANFGAAAFFDKFTLNALSSRAAVLAPLLVAQIHIYLAHLERLVGRLERQSFRNQQAITACKDALAGDGPLFVFLEHDPSFRGRTQVHAFGASDLKELWSEWAYPAYVLRHRFASFHWRFPISRDDVARQMGHANEGVAFDEGDPDSVIRFAERVAAPIDCALRAEGWTLVRSWIPAQCNKPRSAPDCCAIIAADQADITLTHAKLQKDATRRAMGKGVVESGKLVPTRKDKRRMIDLARECVEAGLERWINSPEQDVVRATKQLSRDDVERLTQAISGALPDRSYLVPATNVLRNRLQRMRQVGKWDLELPAPIFVLSVADPVITPACARAFNYCIDTLDRCDRWILEFGPNPQLTWEQWLGVTAIQLAVRNGVVQQSRLIDVFANAARARRHPILPDTLLVPISAAPQALDTSALEDPSDDEEPQGAKEEYLTVQGLPAICLQRIGSVAGLRTPADISAALERSIQTISEYGTDGPENPPVKVADFLSCAQLARRLSMPGLRAAWEAGSLVSRTLPVERQLDVWGSIIRRTPEEDGIPVPPQKDIQNVQPATLNADVLRAVRRIIGLSETERGKPRSSEAVITEIGNALAMWPTVPTTAEWMVKYVVKRLKRVKNRGQRATLYQDLTVFLELFLNQLGEQDLSDLSSDESTELFDRVLSNKHNSDPKRTLKMVRGIAREMLAAGHFEVPDLQVLYRSAGIAAKTPNAYLVSPAESQWICAQLRLWKEEALVRANGSKFRPADLEFAYILWELHYWLGLRTSEGMHLRRAEVVQIDGEWILFIRRTRRRGTKTNASVRPLRLRHFLPAEVLANFEAFLKLQQDSHSFKNDKTVGIFASPIGEGRIAVSRHIAFALNEAMKLILVKGEGRPYAGRHSRATFGLQTILPEEHQSTAWRVEGMPGLPEYVAHLPARYHLRFWSRALGHATTRSSLMFYSHSIADLNGLARGWRAPTSLLLASAAGIKPMTFNSRASRLGLRAEDREAMVGSVLNDKSEPAAFLKASTKPALEHLSNTSKRTTGHGKELVRIVPWAREWLQGSRLITIEHRYGVAVSRLSDFVRNFERLDGQRRAGVIDRTVALDGIEPRFLKTSRKEIKHRGPRRALVLSLAEGFDALERHSAESWCQYLALLKDQRQGLEKLEQGTSNRDLEGELRKIFQVSGLRLSEEDLAGGTVIPMQMRSGGQWQKCSAEFALVNLLILTREDAAIY